MPRPAPEALRQAVAAELQKQPPTSYREIKRKFKVGDELIADVKRKLGLPMMGQKRPPKTPPEAGPEAPPTGGNGLDEFIPPADPKQQQPRAPPTAPSKGASEGARSNPSSSAATDLRPIYACDEGHGGCGAQWRLLPGEEPVTQCPACGVSLGG